jgi:hypothetical protein
MSAFLAFRSSPSPRAMVVLSSPSPVSYIVREGDESLAGLMPYVLAKGMRPLVPPVLDSVLPFVPSWTVSYTPATESLVVRQPGACFYGGSASPLTHWSQAVTLEQECLLIYSHLGLRSEFVQGSASPTIDVFARRGFVCGVTAKAESTGPVTPVAGAEGWYEPLPSLT